MNKNPLAYHCNETKPRSSVLGSFRSNTTSLALFSRFYLSYSFYQASVWLATCYQVIIQVKALTSFCSFSRRYLSSSSSLAKKSNVNSSLLLLNDTPTVVGALYIVVASVQYVTALDSLNKSNFTTFSAARLISFQF